MNFSIALATFNGGRFIQQQLDSFGAQTLRPTELVVCDDGSIDDTIAIVARFAAAAPFRVRLERNDVRLGASDNFFRAASLCSEDWIAFSDQDDVWLPHKLEAIARVVRTRPDVLLAAHRALVVDEDLQPLGELLKVPAVRRLTFFPPRSCRVWLPPLGFTIAFDARLIREYPFETRPIVTHDRWIYVLASSLGNVAYLPETLALYRRHRKNSSQMTPDVGLSSDLLRSDTSAIFAEQAATTLGLAEYFDRCPRTTSVATGSSTFAARSLYRRQARMLHARAQLFDSGRGFPARFTHYAGMLASGAYLSHRRGGLGWRAALKDAARVILRVFGTCAGTM